jgi:hypothetical protein
VESKEESINSSLGIAHDNLKFSMEDNSECPKPKQNK